VAEIASKAQHFVARLRARHVAQEPERVVLRTVVDEDDLGVGGQLPHELRETRAELREDLGLVEDREHEAEGRSLHRGEWGPSTKSGEFGAGFLENRRAGGRLSA